MAAKSGVVIVVSGEDKSGAVLNAVKEHLTEVRERAEEASESMSAFGAMADRAIERLAIYFTVDKIAEGFKEMIKGSVELGEEMGHLAKQTGISADNLSVLKYAADKTGVSFDTFTKGFKKLGESLFEFQQGSVTYVRAFDLLGIGQQEVTATGGDMYKMLELVADKMSQMPDGWQKSAAASEIFGRAGVELIPVLDQGAAGIESFKTEAEDLGLVLNEQTIKKMEELREKSAEIKGAFQGLSLEITSDLAPVLKGLANALTDEAKNLREYFNAFSASAGKTLKMTLFADLASITPGSLGKYFEGKAVQEYTHLDDWSGGNNVVGAPKPKGGGAPVNEAAIKAAQEAEKKRREWVDKLRNKQIKEYVDLQAANKREVEQMNRHSQELGRFVVEQDSKKSAAAAKDLKRQTDVMRAEQEARIRDAGEQMQLAERTAEFNVQMGRETEAQRVEDLRRATDEEAAIKKDAYQKLAGIDAAAGTDPGRVQQDLDAIRSAQEKHDDEMQELAMQDAERRKQIADGLMHSILDPLMDRPKSISDAFKRMADNILSELDRVAEHRVIQGFDGMLSGMPSGPGEHSGVAGLSGLGSIFGKLFGRHGGGKSSNGGYATGAGTIADSAVSLLKQGKGTSAGAVVVNVINQGTPQQAASSGSSGGNGMEQQVITIVMKDADTLGPISKALSGAMKMMG